MPLTTVSPPDAPLRLADTMQRVYSRSDPRGSIPRVTGRPDLQHNRLAAFWRPLVDMTDSDLAPVRLRLIQQVTAWLGADSDRWSWCSRVSIPGVRHQVVVHAGLPAYSCTTPQAMPEHLRTAAWRMLVDSIDSFGALDWRQRSLVVFQLAQLSFHRVALDLAEGIEPAGDPAHEHFRYDLARVAASTPGAQDRALRTFGELAHGAADPVLQVASAFQGIGHSVRDGRDNNIARQFEQAGRESLDARQAPWDSWVAALVRSRFHRAVALLRRAEHNRAHATEEAARAADLHARMAHQCVDDADRLIALENERYLVELQLLLQLDAPKAGRAQPVEALCERLSKLDPFCVQARTTIGDTYLIIDRVPDAARWYEHAGELGTGAGAVAWFRAAQCHLALGDGGAARNAMGRCLELDSSAVEPREVLAATYI